MPEYLDLGGTHRAVAISTTLQHIMPIAKRVGVTRVANVTGLDHIGIPVAIAIRPNAKHISVSQGKGLTWELAKASAVMESIEQWHAENITEIAAYGSYLELASSYAVVDPSLIAHGDYTPDNLKAWQLKWCKGLDLVSNREMLIPFDAISLDSTMPSKAALVLRTSTNGLASGNTLEEATCHALCELIERDAYFKWHYSPEAYKQTRLLNNQTIDSQAGCALLEKLHCAHMRVRVWDMTSEFNIPTFLCMLSDADISRKTQVFAGKGCHFDKQIALTRAITEAAQTRLTFITGSRDDIFPSYYKRVLLEVQDSADGTYDYRNVPQVGYAKDFSKNVKIITQILVDHGFDQIVMVDHTRADIGIPVVHVAIPKLKALLEL